MRLCIFFPSKSKDNIPQKEFSSNKEDLRNAMTHAFGGLTEYQADGHWISGQGSLEDEKITVFEIYTTKDYLEDNSRLKRVILCLELLRKNLAQESVAFSIDNELYFLTKDVTERRNLFDSLEKNFPFLKTKSVSKTRLSKPMKLLQEYLSQP